MSNINNFIGSGTAISSSTGFYISDGNTYQVTTPSMVTWDLSSGSTTDTKGVTKRIGPKLFFSYVKSKFTKSEKTKLKARLSKLQKLVKDAEEMGQKALYEEFGKMLAVVVRESEAVACGYDTFIQKSSIEKFMSVVTENDESKSKIVYFKKLEEFPRAIPLNIQKTIKAAKKKNVFDELWVLYLDYVNEPIKTNKEKIRQKDPILLGRFAYDENKFFYIADWVDEYCDLTLNKFVDTLKQKDEDYKISEVEPIDEALIERIKKEVMERHERLTNTKPNNFRQLMQEEDRPVTPTPEPYPGSPLRKSDDDNKPKKSLFQKIFGI